MSFNLDTEDSPISPEELWGVQTKVRKNNQYTLQESQVRNILVVGRQRAGKSTSIGVLKDPVYEAEMMSLFSNPAGPRFYSFALDNKESGIKYSLNLIDTPGLAEVRPEEEYARTDEHILEAISFCIKNEITRINALMIVVSFEVGITEDDIRCFKMILERFQHGDLKIIIMITRAETKSKDWKENIKSELSLHAFFKPLVKSGNVKIQFSGCVDCESLKNIYTEDEAARKYKAVYNMRKEILHEIFNANTAVSLMELPFSNVQSFQAMNILKEQEKLLKELQEIKDWDAPTSEDHLKVARFAENLKELEKKETAIMLTPDLSKAFKEMSKKVMELIPRVPQKIKPIIVGKLPIVY